MGLKINVPTVDDILRGMVSTLPSEMYAASDPNSNIYNLLRTVAISQHEMLVMLQETVALLDTKQDDHTRLKFKIERKGAFWAP
jgi:hypothetical protein